MKITEDDLDRSVSGILSRFGINKDEARKARKQLNSRISTSEELHDKVDKQYYVYLMNQFYAADSSVDEILMPTLAVAEQVLYRRFYFLSFGHGRTWCQISHAELRQTCNISSNMTIRKGIIGLHNAHCINMIKPPTQRIPPTYRVYLPCEMPQFAEMGIKTGALFMKEESDSDTIRELIISSPEFSTLNNSPLIISSVEELRKLATNSGH